VTDGVFMHPYHPTQMGADTNYHGGARASHILLPVVEA
jgi:hypothetical protein